MEGQPINLLTPEERQSLFPVRRRPRWIIVLVIAVFLFTSWYAYAKISFRSTPKTEPSTFTLQPKKPRSLFQKLTYVVFNHGEQPLAGETNDRINILLLGIGGEGHDGPYLSDTIMMASIKPSTGQVALISIPRDLAISIPGYGVAKINHADAYGENKQANWGGAFATEVISKTFNQPIPYYLRLDFKAFEDIIDEVGGIDVNVERSFTDAEFPAPNDAYKTVSFSKGLIRMDGKTALAFARSRHGNNGEGSDFARARRQQLIMTALKEKLLSFSTISNPVRLNTILNDLETHITTNLDFSEMMTLARLAQRLDINHLTSLVFDSSPNGYLVSTIGEGGAFLLVPKTGNFNAMINAVQNIFNTTNTAQTPTTESTNTPSNDLTPHTWNTSPTTSANNTIEVQNGTWSAGLASRIKKTLQSQKFSVNTAGNANTKPIEKSGIYLITPDADRTVANQLAEKMHVPIREQIPSTITTTSSTAILLILGTDFTE